MFEMTVHHEDVRRANRGEPRTDRPDLDDAVWAAGAALRLFLLRGRVRGLRVELHRPAGDPRGRARDGSRWCSAARRSSASSTCRAARAPPPLGGDADAVHGRAAPSRSSLSRCGRRLRRRRPPGPRRGCGTRRRWPSRGRWPRRCRPRRCRLEHGGDRAGGDAGGVVAAPAGGQVLDAAAAGGPHRRVAVAAEAGQHPPGRAVGPGELPVGRASGRTARWGSGSDRGRRGGGGRVGRACGARPRPAARCGHRSSCRRAPGTRRRRRRPPRR